MRKINVELGTNSYDIYIGPGILAQTGQWLHEKGLPGKLVIITDPTVNGLYGQALSQRLVRDGYKVTTLLVPEGEKHKSLETAGRLYQELTDSYAERTTPILALGGGVIGDLAGFVAATYMRGIPLIHIPTTLLAQVDSSIGGKVAVDHGQLKNKVGAFHQPRLVISDIETLKTLPDHELANGLAEVIKSAAIRNERFFSFLEGNLELVKALDLPTLEEVVFQSAKIKAEIVEKDERELGLRAILNYGHTIGHAIERDKGVLHGEAIATGMVLAARLSHAMNLLRVSDVDLIQELVIAAGLPLYMDLNAEVIFQNIRKDKKKSGEIIQFVLLEGLGKAIVKEIPFGELKHILHDLC